MADMDPLETARDAVTALMAREPNGLDVVALQAQACVMLAVAEELRALRDMLQVDGAGTLVFATRPAQDA